MNPQTKRTATRLAGAALLLSGLAFNPLGLAHFFPAHPLGIEGIIVLQIALLFGGGWLVWRSPRMPLIPIVLVALAFGAVAVLGGYGTVRSLQKVQKRNRLLATIDRSEAVQQHLSGEALPLLALGMYQGQLPVAPARALFAAAVDVADVEQTAEATEVVPAQGITRQRWKVAPAEQFYGSDIQLWGPLLVAVDSWDYAAFHIETGHFLDAEETIYQARVRFDASAQTQDGERAQIRAWLVIDWQQGEDATWRIRRWETESLEMLTREYALFAEVLDAALPHDEDRVRARFSRHAALVRQSFSDSAFVAPHRYFTRQAFDRHPGISVVDIDGDGYDDLYIAVRQGRNMLLHNGGDGTFSERTAQYGLDVEHHTAAALFADFDNDGDPDVFLGRTLAPSLYMVNEDGHFVTRDLGDGVLPLLVASISAADYNGDGLLDVYFSTYAARMLLKAVATASQGVLLADFLPADHARTLYDLSRDRIGHLIYDAPGPPNVLLRNLGDGRFAATAAVWRNTLQATWADYDRDGDPDLYLANDFAANNLLRNDGGVLVDVTAESGAADPGFGMGASWADYDGDGRQDLYVTNMHSSAGRRITEAAGSAFAPLARGNSLLRNGREGFTLVADSSVEDGGWGWGGQFLDFDNDGDLDIYALSGYYTPPSEVALPEDT